MFLNAITAARAAFLVLVENTPPRRRATRFYAPVPITTAEALWASGLSGEELEEAFDALSLVEQARYLAGRRCMGGVPAKCYFV